MALNLPVAAYFLGHLRLQTDRRNTSGTYRLLIRQAEYAADHEILWVIVADQTVVGRPLRDDPEAWTYRPQIARLRYFTTMWGTERTKVESLFSARWDEAAVFSDAAEALAKFQEWLDSFIEGPGFDLGGPAPEFEPAVV